MNPSEDYVMHLAAQAEAQGEAALADYLRQHLAEVAALHAANPLQTEAASADRDNPFQYTMR